MINLGEDLNKYCSNDLYTTFTLTTNYPVQKENNKMNFTTNKEQKYYLRLKKKYRDILLKGDKHYLNDKNRFYLNLVGSADELCFDSHIQMSYYKTNFTLKELKKLRIDLSKFKMIKAEDLADED